MARDIFLVASSNGRRPAHWAIFVPVANTGTKGKKIHVTGNPAQGFFLEFKRSYDYANTTREYKVLLIGQVEDAKVRDVVTQAQSVDTIARDHLERAALDVPSWKSGQSVQSRCTKLSGLDKAYVQQLVAHGLLPDTAVGVASQAPRAL